MIRKSIFFQKNLNINTCDVIIYLSDVHKIMKRKLLTVQINCSSKVIFNKISSIFEAID